MTKKIIFLIILLSFSSLTILGQKSDWLKRINRIKLLSTSRNQVIELLRKPKNSRKSYLEEYVLEDGEVSIQYSSNCKKTTVEGKEVIEGWNIPAWMVVDISFSPNKRLTPKELKKELKFDIADFPDTRIYENDKLGISFSITDKRLEEISFYPTNKYNYIPCK